MNGPGLRVVFVLRHNGHSKQNTNYIINMKKLLCLLAVTALIAAPAFAGEFPDITIPEVKKAIADGKATIIDVNGAQSYKNGHVPGALNFADISADLAKKLPADKSALVIAYCGGPSCNAYTKAANAAVALGYTNVKHMSAGISGWLQAGEKTEK
jgi:rhodanese-related sulfurtransferase